MLNTTDDTARPGKLATVSWNSLPRIDSTIGRDVSAWRSKVRALVVELDRDNTLIEAMTAIKRLQTQLALATALVQIAGERIDEAIMAGEDRPRRARRAERAERSGEAS